MNEDKGVKKYTDKINKDSLREEHRSSAEDAENLKNA